LGSRVPVINVETGPPDGKRGIQLGRRDRKERDPGAGGSERDKTVESDC
jgi:hypothetical protein